MVAPVVHLLGPSSSGKSSVARALQRLHPHPVILLAADQVLRGLPLGHPGLEDTRIALAFQQRIEAAYYATLRSFAQLDIPVIGEQAWVDRQQPAACLAALADVPLRTVLVCCDLAVAEQRERRRRDQIHPGTARAQHQRHINDFPYDLIVDTTTATPEQAAAPLLPLLQQPHD